MPPVTVAIDIPAPPDEVWAEVEAIERHVEWMADAESLQFVGDQRRGRGTRIAVETRLGPMRTTDIMEFTAWDPPRRMAVTHQGLFTGHGEFRLQAVGDDATRFSWSETIRFPWYLGGPVGAALARPILRWVWRRNLERLRDRFTGR